MPNAISMLRSDHARVKRLLKRLEQTGERGVKMRRQLLGEIEKELKIHAKLEEEIFYPAFKGAAKKDDQDLFYEANEEHAVVDTFLPTMKATSPGSEVFSAKAKVLKDLVEHHIEEEEGEMFPKAQRLLRRELDEIGKSMAARKKTLVAQWGNPILRPLKRAQSAVEKLVPASVKHTKGSAIASARPKRAAKKK
jgi:hemerythrin-like domain-containing protein